MGSTVQGSWRRPNIVNDGLVLYLDANAANSYNQYINATTWKDISGNNLTGSLINGPTFDSANGGSIVFDGVNDIITAPTSPKFAFGSNNFTIHTWYKRTSRVQPYPRIWQFGDGWNTTQNWAFLDGHNSFAQNKFVLHVFAQNGNTSPLIISNTTISSSTWYSLFLVRQSNVWSLYVNGVFDISANWSGSPDNGVSNTFKIGGAAYNNDDFLKGNVSIIIIYNRAFTTTEITQNFNATRARFGI